MNLACKHEDGYRFLACSAADRLPGVWVCRKECGYYTVQDPTGNSSIRYTEGPRQEKIVNLKASKF